jgi:predicted nucleic acid-binding protein
VNSTPGEFLDSNVLLYAFTTDPRAERAQGLLASGCTVSVQGRSEFANVRKLGMTGAELREALAGIRTVCRAILPIDIDTHIEGLRIAERYESAIFDALMVATASRRLRHPVVRGYAPRSHRRRAAPHRQPVSIASIH